MTVPLDVDELKAIRIFLEASGVDVAGDLRATLIAGGRSNLTVRLDDGASRWVLRMPPRAGRTPSAHDVAREFRVTRALHGTGVPVPPPVALCQDESVLGCDFAVAEFVDGSTLQSQDDLELLDDEALDAVVTSLVETLAVLHRTDHAALGLESFGRADGYVERQTRRWAGQWELVAPKDVAIRTAADELHSRLTEAVPEQRFAGIVHGDFRIDNTLLDLRGVVPRVGAVVDWELSTIGDPAADVAMMCAYRHPAFDLVLGSPAAWTSVRLPVVDELATRYVLAGGVDLGAWEFYLGLAYYKIAVIAAGIDHRHRAGGGAAVNDTAARAVAPFLAAGLDVLRPAAYR